MIFPVHCVFVFQMEVQQYYTMSEITMSGKNIPKPIIHFAEAAFPGTLFCAVSFPFIQLCCEH